MTDFQSLVDQVDAMACVISVEQLEDGRAGDFRVVTGNEAYIRSITQPAPAWTSGMIRIVQSPNTSMESSR